MRRYLAMDVILPYVAWITLLAFLIDVRLLASAAPAVPLVRSGEGGMTRSDFENVWKEYGDQIVLEDISLEIAAARLRRAGRPIRLRQDDVPAHAARRGEADARADPGRRRAAAAGAGRRSRRGVSALLRVPASDRVAERHARRGIACIASFTAGCSARRGVRPGTRRRRCSPRSASPARRTNIRRTFGRHAAASRLGAGDHAGPKILLLDEPFGALDPGIRAEIHVLMKRLWNEIELTVVMVTHDLSEAFRLGTRVIVLRANARPAGRARALWRDGVARPRNLAASHPHRSGSETTLRSGRDDPVRQGAPAGTARHSSRRNNRDLVRATKGRDRGAIRSDTRN